LINMLKWLIKWAWRAAVIAVALAAACASHLHVGHTNGWKAQLAAAVAVCLVGWLAEVIVPKLAGHRGGDSGASQPAWQEAPKVSRQPREYQGW
jgi:hypothetical protein